MIYVKLSIVFIALLIGASGPTQSALSAEKLQTRFSSDFSTPSQNLVRIRFGIVIGSPPFGFLDRENRLSGLNVDLVRRICAKLPTVPNCEIQEISADTFETALNTGTVDAIIGALKPSETNRDTFNFGKAFILPAYFHIKRKGDQSLKSLGVLSNLFSEGGVKKLANGAKVVEFDSYDALLTALSSAKITSGLVPSYAAQFWLLSAASKKCCTYDGPINLPFIETSRHRIVTNKTNAQLHEVIENAVHELEISGELGELRRRYLPLLRAH